MVFADAKQCKAKAKSTGERCKSPAVTGYDVCRVHGGKTPRGIASANTKHGRYSKDLPTRLLGRYEEALSDSELGALKSEIALLDTRIGEVLSKIDVDNFGSIWMLLSKTVNNLSLAMKSGDGKATIEHMNDLQAIVKSGVDDTINWNIIVNLIEQRRKLTDSERRRQVDLQQMITADRAMLLISSLVGIIKSHVTDRSKLAAISTDIGHLIAARDSITIE